MAHWSSIIIAYKSHPLHGSLNMVVQGAIPKEEDRLSMIDQVHFELDI